MIPFVDLKVQYQTIKQEIDEAVANVLGETAFIGGKYVKSFEEAFAKTYGVKHCISTANGTDSLYVVMKMLGIGKGDEVITPVNSWISSSETVSQTGAKPVFVDIDPKYYSINEEDISAKITDRTKMIMPVHLHGQACNMDAIMEIANKYNLYVLEDCAQSHFSEFKGKRVGKFGNASSFSFYPGKNLGAYGDAGCILTNDDELAEKCRMYARHGALTKHQHQIEGINSRLDGIQAAILEVKLKYILNWTSQRKQVATWYNDGLKDAEGVTIPDVRPNSSHTYHLYVIRVNDRAGLQSFLKEKGVSTSIHYPKILSHLKAYEYLGHTPQDFPVASAYESQILSLPMYPELSAEQVVYICHCIKEYQSR